MEEFNLGAVIPDSTGQKQFDQSKQCIVVRLFFESILVHSKREFLKNWDDKLM
jgi:hypothetical protein